MTSTLTRNDADLPDDLEPSADEPVGGSDEAGTPVDARTRHWLARSRARPAQRSSTKAATARSRRRRTVLLAVAALSTAVAASVPLILAAEGPNAAPAVRGPVVVDRDEQLRDLVNRGVVPRQALGPVVDRDEQLRDLVNRGVVPRQALGPVVVDPDEQR